MLDVGKAWPSKSDYKLLVVILIHMCIPGHFFIFFTIVKWRILGDLLAFLIQSTADTWRNDSRQRENPQHFEPIDLAVI